MDSVITITNLSKDYRATRKTIVHALAGISLEVKRGEIFGLLGPNGAGKTTLIKLLLGIARPTGGTGVLLGHPLGNAAAKFRVGYLPENHRFPNYLTGEQVLRYFGQLSGMHGAALAGRIETVLTLVNMRDWRSTRIKKYSKGMLQRIGLAQAMLNEPEVLFLDEPTDGVDPIGRKEIRQTLVHLKETGTTVFLNSHLLSEVELISDRVAILNKGSLVSMGTVDALTRTTNEVVITVGGNVEAAAAVARTVSKRADIDGNTIVAELADGAEMNPVIDALRAAGVDIREMAHRRASLEDAFMSLIERVHE